MKFGNIEVSGIKRIVIDRTHIWCRQTDTGLTLWGYRSENGTFHIVSDDTMMERVRSYAKNRAWKVWSNLDTLNITKRPVRTAPQPEPCENTVIRNIRALAHAFGCVRHAS